MSDSSRYDDIVIGAGASGVALATRLSEDPGRRVVLVEAGPDYATVADTPPDIMNANAMSMAEHDWRFQAASVKGRKIRFPRGRVVGGSSAVGGTVALRAIPDDFDEWAAAGNSEWGWRQTLPYYRALEDDQNFAGEYHGKSGPIPIARWPWEELTPVQQFFVDACMDAGYPWAEDQNHPTATGVGVIPSNRRDGAVRVSTAMGYLPAARSRENFSIISGALVNRVLLRDGRAYGVELQSGSTARQLVGRRVILSAGTIGSPTILMRSGIGNEDDLRGLGVEVRVSLPGVGAGVMDHPRSGVFMKPKAGAENYGEPVGQVVLRTTSAAGSEKNDVHYYMVNGFDLSQQFPDMAKLVGAPRMFGLMIVDQRPHARGRVTITSTDPHVPPHIDMNYLAGERDYRFFLEGLRFCWELANTAKIQDQSDGFVVVNEAMVNSDDALRGYIERTVDSTYHPVGTVRMGRSSDPGAVVDQQCKVHGVEGLCVVDASIMPFNVRANTHLTSIMIGERAAALLS